ncbi:MAG: NTP transferase domain-containing protein [Pseudomonadota bacterium]
MQIIIPMSGVGQRFINAGYQQPKPLIEIDGKPIIQHVVELFPGESNFTFICNQPHLEQTPMRDVLNALAPSAQIVAIDSHKLGPVYAVAQVFDRIKDDEEVIVNYCDFGTYWDYFDFLKHTRDRDADGAIPAYKGFHPHMLGSTNYAFMRDEKQWMREIKEKSPFTDDRTQEYASNGTYYFKQGRYVKKYFNALMEQKHHLKGEYYVSLVYNLLIQDQRKVSIYEIQHMLQWGTPQDVSEYMAWSHYFRHILSKTQAIPRLKNSVTLIPLAGRGSRFVKEGYKTPKPLLDVSGKPMIIQANQSLPSSEKNRYVCLQEHINNYHLDKKLRDYQPDCDVISINQVTEGQAITCQLGLEGVDENASLTIGACDNGMLWDAEKYQQLITDETIDGIIWTFVNHPSSRNHPEMYGWVKTCDAIATGVSVKKAISETPEKDHAVVGTFWFRRVSLFQKGLAYLLENNVRINNEFYVDSLMDALITLNYRIAVFPVDAYLGWGTPSDYETFRYWQSYFHKTSSHAYQLQQDPTVESEKIATLEKTFFKFKQKFV